MTSGILAGYMSRLNQALESIDPEAVKEVIRQIERVSNNLGRVWIIGNGGSALTSSHFATDLTRCSTKDGNVIRAVSLCDNVGILTAVSNDFAFTEVFVKQLQMLFSKGDLLITISASGNSLNILKSLEFGKENTVTTIAFTGFSGGSARELCDVSVHVKTAIGDYGIAEDAHSILMHFICGQLRV